MEIALKNQVGLIESQIVDGKCCFTVCEFDPGGEIIGTVTFVTNPGNIIDLAKDLIVAAADLKQQLAQNDPFSQEAQIERAAAAGF